ncbi:3-hydroxyacyl-CoA dehydrogenase NAD-binding domain-containing protein [Conexibacter sp. SYSU D00693]|uniref:3-hydroxyacyl-CoA dehydrogenase NAD-binding domain-containing protein n=1 Tax=Conexibacter sp. SYSU D00693 TaxID=2812560 RepID=UPI00196B5570|nr:3-hydroxyacyl-CoA dehydrogenase NAD-binding domain-containing protein [Conexibacter sp. SYSU D00693]
MIGVVGAGTMGSGIAQLGAMAGDGALVFDPVEGAAARGVDRAQAGLEKLRAKGRLEREPGVLRVAPSLDDLAGCEVVVEAAPERLDLKHELVAELSGIAPDAVLASNTSSIPITAIARAAADPSKVVGLHFFNPAPLMRLVELIPALQSSPASLDTARALGERMGRHVIEAADVPGFLVNRCNRPFGLEALRLLQERIADVATIDRIVRAAGFRMGPFELQDLVGIDVGLEVSRSFAELSFGEPRWRPSPLSAQRVAAGRLGRKTGEGWYRYAEGRPHRPEDPPAPEPGAPDGAGLVVVAGHLPVAFELAGLAAEAGFDVVDEEGADGEVPWLIVDCGGAEVPLQGGPQVLLCAEGSLHALDPSGSSAGFHWLPGAQLAELTRSSTTTDVAAARAEAFFHGLGLHTAWVGDAPGLVLGRIVCQLVNECAFAVGEGVGSAQDVDDGLQLGLNHPRGALEWADAVAPAHVLLVLEALREELGDAYRPAPLLRRLVACGEGFHGELDDGHDHDHHDHPH